MIPQWVPDPDARWGRTPSSAGTTPTFVGVVFEEKDRIPRVIRSYSRSDPGLLMYDPAGVAIGLRRAVEKFPTGKRLLLSVKSFSFLLETFRYYPSNFLTPTPWTDRSARIATEKAWGPRSCGSHAWSVYGGDGLIFSRCTSSGRPWHSRCGGSCCLRFRRGPRCRWCCWSRSRW